MRRVRVTLMSVNTESIAQAITMTMTATKDAFPLTIFCSDTGSHFRQIQPRQKTCHEDDVQEWGVEEVAAAK